MAFQLDVRLAWFQVVLVPVVIRPPIQFAANQSCAAVVEQNCDHAVRSVPDLRLIANPSRLRTRLPRSCRLIRHYENRHHDFDRVRHDDDRDANVHLDRRLRELRLRVAHDPAVTRASQSLLLAPRVLTLALQMQQ